MTAKVYVNADRSAIVPEGSAEAAMQLHVRDAKRLGLVVDEDAKPQARRGGTKVVEDKARHFTTTGPVEDSGTATETTDAAPKRSAKK